MSASSAASPGRNRLARETSPYLLQHAGNPVDWYPWGPEAIELAVREDRPIFLSVGYSACHWCHVMEHESFENDSIAELMNRLFVNIKVDREERPDIDQIYMNAVLALTGHGGWPMSVFLTPELEPFYGGTYWPPERRGGMPGFREVLTKVRAAWDEQRDAVQNNATKLTDAVRQLSQPQAEPEELQVAHLEQAMGRLIGSADRQYGGFGRAPKFPHPMDLRFLLRAHSRFGDQGALDVTVQAMDHMARGGLYDQLGGGFHRYSTDARWLVPHFEKMLYDNAQLAVVYLEAAQVTGRDDFRQTARETLDYVLREMTHADGGFCSTQDADSEGEEGKFFVWSQEEVDELLGEEASRLFCQVYDVTPQGNWEGKSILNRPLPPEETAARLGLTPEQLEKQLAPCRQTLLAARGQRVAPGTDDKIIAAWNGMMLTALARGARVLGDPRYTAAAVRAADFILQTMQTVDGRLLHSWRNGQGSTVACLDDLACMIDGLTELYEATFDPRHLAAAVSLSEQLLEHHADPESGGFFYTSADVESLITRARDSQDTATPSGNSMAALALFRLGRLTGKQPLEDAARRVLNSISGQVAQVPAASGQALIALDCQLGPMEELVFAASGPHSDEELQAAATTADQTFRPRSVRLARPAGTADSELPEVLQPLLRDRAAAAGSLSLWACTNGACELPVHGVDAVCQRLSES